MAIDAQTIDNAVQRLLDRFTPEQIATLVQSNGSLWNSLSVRERMEFGFFRREIRDVLVNINGLHVLASAQRVRPELAQILATDAGLPWLTAQVDDLRSRTLA